MARKLRCSPGPGERLSPVVVEAPDREPLYVEGKRRPGQNLWGYDPAAPDLLEPAKHVVFRKKPPAAVLVAVAYWASLQVWEDRKRVHPELCKRRKRVGRLVVVVEPPKPRKPRGDWRRWIHRACQVIAEHATVRGGGLAGLWVGQKFERFLSAHEWAARVGCTVKAWHKIVGHLKSADWIKPRRQRRDKECAHGCPACDTCIATGRFTWKAKVASFCVTDLFWMSAPGAWGQVLKFRSKLAARERKAQQATQPPREHPPTAPEPAGFGGLAALTAAQAEELAELRRQMDEARRQRQRNRPPP